MRKTEPDDSIEVVDAGDSEALGAVLAPEPDFTPTPDLTPPQPQIAYVSFPGYHVVKGSKADQSS